MSVVDVRAALSSIVRDELARRRLPDFIELVEPSYERARHTVVLCDHLEAVERGDVAIRFVIEPTQKANRGAIGSGNGTATSRVRA